MNDRLSPAITYPKLSHLGSPQTHLGAPAACKVGTTQYNCFVKRKPLRKCWENEEELYL